VVAGGLPGAASLPNGTEAPLAAPPLVEPAPRPPAARVAKPDTVRGIYLNAWAAGSPRKFANLVALAQRTELNAFVIDVKEGGEVSYRSAVALARQVGAERDYVRDVRARLDTLRRHGIYPIARIVVFKDGVLAEARPDLAIRKADGSLWADAAGAHWVDPFNREVWDYNVALAREAVELGFAEIQWDYVRFPDVPRSLMRTAVHPAQAGRSKAQGIREFLVYAREQLADLGVPLTADVFGLTVSDPGDMGIGQRWEEFIDVVDVVLPMVYPSHFARGTYGIANPNAAPYQTVKRAMEHAVRRSAGIAGAATIRPWLQDFNAPWVDRETKYGPAEVRAQIQAVYDAGLTEWILWHPGSNYTEAALATAGGAPPRPPAVAPPAGADSAARGPALLGDPVSEARRPPPN
jgi:hypothetical protein